MGLPAHPVTYILAHNERIYFTGDIIAVRDYLDLDIDLVVSSSLPDMIITSII